MRKIWTRKRRFWSFIDGFFVKQILLHLILCVPIKQHMHKTLLAILQWHRLIFELVCQISFGKIFYIKFNLKFIYLLQQAENILLIGRKWVIIKLFASFLKFFMTKRILKVNKQTSVRILVFMNTKCLFLLNQ